MFFDSRGRIYYKNTFISPQSNDVGKNQIEFANGTKLEDEKYF